MSDPQRPQETASSPPDTSAPVDPGMALKRQ
ncbi:MAG: hypothetical protein JWL81_2701, partial [Verrucomicrobiales bacterium]|nr:hypothetical protein [Verrucomicrobiales bacterium]